MLFDLGVEVADVDFGVLHDDYGVSRCHENDSLKWRKTVDARFSLIRMAKLKVPNQKFLKIIFFRDTNGDN